MHNFKATFFTKTNKILLFTIFILNLFQFNNFLTMISKPSINKRKPTHKYNIPSTTPYNNKPQILNFFTIRDSTCIKQRVLLINLHIILWRQNAQEIHWSYRVGESILLSIEKVWRVDNLFNLERSVVTLFDRNVFV